MKKILILIFLFLLCSCEKSPSVESYRFYAMDTMISIQFYNVENSKEISKEVEKIYLKYDAVASDFQSGYGAMSVYDLNEKRQGIVSDELLELIEFSLQMKEETDGYYNPFIGKLTQAWKKSFEEKKWLDEEKVNLLLEESLSTNLHIDGKNVTLLGEGNLDLGGIAKGYATEQVEQYLKVIHCTDFLLNAGSSNIVLGSKVGQPFKVGLSQAFGNDYFMILEYANQSISTSSMKEQHVLYEGSYYSHLINAKTGYPANLYETMSIIGDDSGVLDAYSTACFSMELSMAKDFLKEKNLEFVVSKDNQLLYQSNGVISCTN